MTARQYATPLAFKQALEQRLRTSSATGVEVAFGNPLVGEPDVVVTDDVLAFAGIAPSTFRLYPVVSHIAEKLHAFTMPRPRPNSRVRDLPDLALLATTGPIEGAALRRAIELTFGFRGTHPVPMKRSPPPMDWTAPYARMAEDDDLAWKTLAQVTRAVETSLNPVLESAECGTWTPSGCRRTKGA